MATGPGAAIEGTVDKIMGKNSYSPGKIKVGVLDPWKKTRETHTAGQQGQFNNLLMAQAYGKGPPSVAQEQLKQSRDSAIKGAMAGAAGARGSNVALAGRNASQAGAKIAMDANRAGAELRAKEMAASQQAFMANLQATRQQDLMSQGLSLEQARDQANADIAVMQAKAGISEGNAARGSSGIGGLMSMAALGFAASGLPAKSNVAAIGAPAANVSPQIAGGSPLSAAASATSQMARPMATKGGPPETSTALGAAFANETPYGPTTPHTQTQDDANLFAMHENLARNALQPGHASRPVQDELPGLSEPQTMNMEDASAYGAAVPTPMGHQLGQAAMGAAPTDAQMMQAQPNLYPNASKMGHAAQMDTAAPPINGDTAGVGAAAGGGDFTSNLQQASQVKGMLDGILGGGQQNHLSQFQTVRPQMAPSDPEIKDISTDKQFPLIEEAAKIQPIQYQYKPEFTQQAEALGQTIANPEAMRPGVAADGGAGSMADNKLYSHAVAEGPMGVASLDPGQVAASNTALGSEMAKRLKAQEAKMDTLIDALSAQRGEASAEVAKPSENALHRADQKAAAATSVRGASGKTSMRGRQPGKVGPPTKKSAAFSASKIAGEQSFKPAMGDFDSFSPRGSVRAREPDFAPGERVDTNEPTFGEWRMQGSEPTYYPEGTKFREHPEYASLREFSMPTDQRKVFMNKDREPPQSSTATKAEGAFAGSEAKGTAGRTAGFDKSAPGKLRDNSGEEKTRGDNFKVKFQAPGKGGKTVQKTMPLGKILDETVATMGDTKPYSKERRTEIRAASNLIGGGRMTPRAVGPDEVFRRLKSADDITWDEVRDALHGVDL